MLSGISNTRMVLGEPAFQLRALDSDENGACPSPHLRASGDVGLTHGARPGRRMCCIACPSVSKLKSMAPRFMPRAITSLLVVCCAATLFECGGSVSGKGHATAAGGSDGTGASNDGEAGGENDDSTDGGDGDTAASSGGGAGLAPGDGDGDSGSETGGTGGGETDPAGSGGRLQNQEAGRSCAGDEGDECQGDSCCSALLVPGGEFGLGRSEVATEHDYYPGGYADELPEMTVKISPFYLDKYEVTVSRFRQFVGEYEGDPPEVGEGGLLGEVASGWLGVWDDYVAPTTDALLTTLSCNLADNEDPTWTDEPGNNENYPINCVSWFMAFQFCVWDGGRLPTEAEWEFTAAGGALDQLYPWGQEAEDCNRANLDDCNGADVAPVGSFLGGESEYGHQDLAGNVSEWVLDRYEEDFYAGLVSGEVDPANSGGEGFRSYRGSTLFDPLDAARSALRLGGPPDHVATSRGFRCARN